MEWARPTSLVITILFLLHFMCFGYGDQLSSVSVKSKTNISSIPCVQDFQAMKKAMCSYRNLKHVPSYLYEDIIILDLGYNQINVLYNASFQRYTLLVVLLLNNNDITYIDTGAFYPLKHLSAMILANNVQMPFSNSDIVRQSETLDILELGWNFLTYFPNDTLKWLPRINSLDLQGNSFEYINLTYCPRDQKLERVDLGLYSVPSITEETFRFTCKCKRLLLLDNYFDDVDPRTIATLQVSHLDIGFSLFKLYSSQVYKNLLIGIALSPIESLTLHLPDFREFHFSSDFFDPLWDKHLSDLEIVGKSTRLDSYVFRNVSHVKRLMISATFLEVFIPEFFDGMVGLRHLDLHDNKITHFNPISSTWELNITHLDLSHNYIKRLSDKAVTGLCLLEILDLSYNHQLTIFQYSRVNPPLPESEAFECLRNLIFCGRILLLPETAFIYIFAKNPTGRVLFPSRMFQLFIATGANYCRQLSRENRSTLGCFTELINFSWVTLP